MASVGTTFAFLVLLVAGLVLPAHAGVASLELLATLTTSTDAPVPVEQVAYGRSDKVAYLIGGSNFRVVDLQGLDVATTYPVTLTTLWETNVTAEITDVAFCSTKGKGYVAISLSGNPKTLPGSVHLYTAYRRHSGATPVKLHEFEVGYLPDQLVFSKDCERLLTANEGEPSGYNTTAPYAPLDPSTDAPAGSDPPGSVSIIKLTYYPGHTATNSPCGKEVCRVVVPVGFEDFNGANQPTGIRTRPGGSGSSFEQNLEPEYVALSPDGKTAYVNLQENNAIATLDLETEKITRIASYGYKLHDVSMNALDGSDRDPQRVGTSGGCPGSIKILTWPVKGMYMPDGIRVYRYEGQDYILTANEGDTRDYTASGAGYIDEARVSSLTLTSDLSPFTRRDDNGNPISSPLTLTSNSNIGRLKVSKSDTGNPYSELYSFGARSFSIFRASDMELIFDSANQMETETQSLLFDSNSPAVHDNYVFNSGGLPNGGGDTGCDTRSDDKGPEPEEVDYAKLGDSTLAFVGAERNSGVYIYNITDPAATTFESFNKGPPGMRAPEGLTAVKYSVDSAGATDMEEEDWTVLLVAYEGSSTGVQSGLAVWRVKVV